jgi:hypothetical protein
MKMKMSWCFVQPTPVNVTFACPTTIVNRIDCNPKTLSSFSSSIPTTIHFIRTTHSVNFQLFFFSKKKSFFPTPPTFVEYKLLYTALMILLNLDSNRSSPLSSHHPSPHVKTTMNCEHCTTENFLIFTYAFGCDCFYNKRHCSSLRRFSFFGLLALAAASTSRASSRNDASMLTLSRAEHSKKRMPNSSANCLASCCDTCRSLSGRSHLLPSSTIGALSASFACRICSAMARSSLKLNASAIE